MGSLRTGSRSDSCLVGSTGEACWMFSALFAAFSGTLCLSWVLSLLPWLCSWICLWSSQHLISAKGAVLGGSPPSSPASALYVSLLARVPLGDFLPSGQLAIQACVTYENTMELDPKKLVVITKIIIIYIVKNLG